MKNPLASVERTPGPDHHRSALRARAGAKSDATLNPAVPEGARPVPAADDDLGILITEVLHVLEERAAIEPVHDFPLDEAGNAQALARYLGGIRWVFTPGRGNLVYDARQGLFRADLAEPVVLAAIERVARLRADLKDVSPDEWKARAAFAAKSASKQGIRAVLDLAQKTREVFRLDRQLDAAGDWINAAGQAIPLRQGLEHARPATPADLFTRTTCRAERGPTPVFDAFLDSVSCHREDWKKWVMRYIGYGLTADTSASFFAIFWGRGRNGKGTFERLLKKTHGTYFGTLATSVVLQVKFDGTGPRPDLVDIDGLRLAAAPEVPPGRLNIDILKTITGGDSISAARKHKDNIVFTPVAKVFLTANTEPSMDRVDEAIRRRVRKVPFDLVLSQTEIDPHIEERLAAEAPAVLARFIDEAVEYYRLGTGPRAFPASPAIEGASQDYLEEQDTVAQWREAQTVATGSTRASILYKAYRAWAEIEGLNPISQKAFGQALVAAGLSKTHSKAGCNYSPITLVTDGDGLTGVSENSDYARSRENNPKNASHPSPVTEAQGSSASAPDLFASSPAAPSPPPAPSNSVELATIRVRVHDALEDGRLEALAAPYLEGLERVARGEADDDETRRASAMLDEIGWAKE